MDNILSAKAQNRKRAESIGAQVLTTACSMAPKDFFYTNTLKTDKTKETTVRNVTNVTNKAEESPGMLSVTNIMGLLQITEVNLQSPSHDEKILVLCYSACSNS